MVIAGINSQIDKITGIVNMVDKGAPLSAARYFFKHISGKVSTYEEAKQKFLKKYIFEDTRFRLLEI
jgi:hypothetical protein